MEWLYNDLQEDTTWFYRICRPTVSNSTGKKPQGENESVLQHSEKEQSIVLYVKGNMSIKIWEEITGSLS